MSIGERIRKLRGPLSQAQLAEMLGVSQNAVGQYERGRQMPGASFLMVLSKHFKVSSDWILFGDEETTSESAEPLEAQTPSGCPRCAELEAELRLEREERREIQQEMRELARENRELLKQNGDLRVELERAKARAAPEEEPEGASSGKDAAA